MCTIHAVKILPVSYNFIICVCDPVILSFSREEYLNNKCAIGHVTSSPKSTVLSVTFECRVRPGFQWLLKECFWYLCKAQSLQMEVSYFYSNQTLRHALYMFDHKKWNTSYVSCCFNYSLILICIRTCIFVIETKPFVNVPLLLILYIFVRGVSVVCFVSFFLAISLGKKSPTWTV